MPNKGREFRDFLSIGSDKELGATIVLSQKDGDKTNYLDLSIGTRRVRVGKFTGKHPDYEGKVTSFGFVISPRANSKSDILPK